MSELEFLDLVFGPGKGETPEARARESKAEFVRGLDQLSMATAKATGRRLTAREALQAYGFEKLAEAASEGSAVLATSWDVPGRTLRSRREALGLEPRFAARQAGVTERELEACEQSKRLPIRVYERIARSLGLDERFVAVREVGVGNASIAVRLRNLSDSSSAMTPAAVAALAEAAWVGATQNRLEAELGFGFDRHGLEPSGNYGSVGFPAYRWGYQFALAVRASRSLRPEAPVASMRELVEDYFGVPLIQTELGESIAGATLESEANRRCIVVNLSGHNRNVLWRRATIAHELGHLLFDPAQNLESLRVDTYAELERVREQLTDRVEQRANAFAVELLAPQQAILGRYNSSKDDGLYSCMEHYGVGFTAARYQIWNGSDRTLDFDKITTRARGLDEQKGLTAWDGAEAFTVDFPMHPLPSVRHSRQGKFCAVVLRAAETGNISWDTAASHLEVEEKDARAAVDAVRELFPSVWSSPV